MRLYEPKRSPQGIVLTNITIMSTLITVGLAIELKPSGSQERRAAILLRRLITGATVTDVRNMFGDVKAITEPAGLHLGTGGSHMYICRQSDIDEAERIRQLPYPENEKAPRGIDIPRWGYIGPEEDALSWQRTAARPQRLADEI